MAAADKSKRLPKELQDFKKELKKLTFKEKVKAYFDCKPSKDVLATRKRNLILTIFTKKEADIFARDFYPIFTAIDHYADKMRTAKMNIDYDAYYLDSLLRNIDYSRYVADFPTERLIHAPNTILTPHLGGTTIEAESNCARMAAAQCSSPASM